MGVIGNIHGGTGGTGGSGGAGGTGGTGGVGGTGGTGGVGGTGGSGGTGGAGTPGSKWYNGAGAPSDGVGVDGDYYLNDTNGDVYVKAGGTWS